MEKKTASRIFILVKSYGQHLKRKNEKCSVFRRNGDARNRWYTISAHAVVEEKCSLLILFLQMKILEKKNHKQNRECHCCSAVGVVPHQSLDMSFIVSLGKKIKQGSKHSKVNS